MAFDLLTIVHIISNSLIGGKGGKGSELTCKCSNLLGGRFSISSDEQAQARTFFRFKAQFQARKIF